MLDELAAELGPIFSLGAGPLRMAVVGDPSALHELFAMPTDHFRWGHKFNVLGFVVGPGSLIVSDGEDHARRRGAVKLAFTRRQLNGLVPMILECADRGIDGVVHEIDGAARIVDLEPVARSIVLEIVVRAFFGERLAARAAEIGTLFERPQRYLESPVLAQLPHPIPGTARAQVRTDRRGLDAIIDQEIAHLRAGPGGDRADLLSTLVADGTLSDSEIRDQVVSLMGAGYHTTTATLSWMFWCVSLVPGLWGRLRLEADRVLGSIDAAGAVDATALAGLDLAHRTMRETMRLHPAGLVSPREAARDLVLAGYRIPKGTLVLWSAHLAGRDPQAWPDPLAFDPDRFEDLTPQQQEVAAMAWVPFGRGPRNCLGFALAQMELTIILSRIAQRLDLATDAEAVPVPVGMVVNRPTGGAPMLVGAAPMR